MSRLKKSIVVLIFIIGLILVRMYESAWFYDPFLNYFKGSYKENPFPVFNNFELFVSIGFRYLLNTIFSLGIIYFLFNNKDFLKVAGVLYLLFFVILITIFLYIINYTDHSNNFTLFYIRRFLIQPLFLLIFLPGFYFQLKNTKITL